MAVHARVEDKRSSVEVGHRHATGGVGDGLDRHQGKVDGRGSFRPVNRDLGHSIDAKVGHEFKIVICHHRAGNVVIGDFHQVNCRLQIVGCDSCVGCKDPGPPVDSHRLTSVGRDKGCSHHIGRRSGATL